MSDEPFMDAIVEMVIFLDLGDEEVVDDDYAVEMLENIAATLKRLDSPTMERFLQYLAERARETQSSLQRQAIENLADSVGPFSE